MRMGQTPYRAAMEAADEIGLTVIAISMTIVAVFVPVSFMGGVAGQFFKQFGATVAIAVLFSLLVARLLTPMLAAYFLTPARAHQEPSGAVLGFYTRLVGWSVRHRFLTVLIGIVLFIGSLASTRLLPSGFIPAQDTSRSVLAVQLPPGSRLGETEAVAARISAALRGRTDVASVFVDGGKLPNGTESVSDASVIISYVPKADREASQSQLEQEISAQLADIPDVRTWFVDENGARPVTLVVTGEDPAAVTEAAGTLASQMSRLPSLRNVTALGALDRPELRIEPHQALAADLGVSMQALSETVRIATIGDNEASLAKFRAGDRLIPIRVQLPPSAGASRATLETLRVPTERGGLVPLAAVADIVPGTGPVRIDRYDRARQVTVEADLVDHTPLGRALQQIDRLQIMRHPPSGVTITQAGDAEIMGELFSGFSVAIRDGLLLVYGVLVVLFGSFLQPFTILISLPLSVGGAIFALLAAGEPISMPVVIGILMLMGIVTKNAIMLVDFALDRIKRGMARQEAIVDAGRRRARPIVMTTIAMVGGMAPSALGIGAGGEFRSPMAIAVIGGLIVSTILSLVFVPAFFAVVDDVGRLLGRLFRGLVGPGRAQAEGEAAAEPPKGAAE
jgi:multidrug efflux pump subunit AcrB